MFYEASVRVLSSLKGYYKSERGGSLLRRVDGSGVHIVFGVQGLIGCKLNFSTFGVQSIL